MYTNQNSQNKTLGMVWIECMKDILNHGKKITDDNELLFEINNYYVTIEETSEDDSILKAYANSKRIAFMKEKYNSCNILPGYKISYGKLLYDNDGVNQINWIVNRLQYKPETKSATISMHIPGEDNLSCLSLLDFKLRNGKLDMSAVYRSQNIFSSMPGNYVALADIQKFVAEKLGVPVGVIEGIILSAHIYEKDIPAASDILKSVYNKQ